MNSLRHRKPIRPYTPEPNTDDDHNNHNQQPTQQDKPCESTCQPQDKDSKQSSDKTDE